MCQFVSHELHVGGNVCKELPIARAQVVEIGFAVAVAGEPVLGALAVAGKEELAFAALAGQPLRFHLCKGPLLWAVHHGGDGLPGDVAQ